MLKTIDLVESLKEEEKENLKEMLEMVNIPDFTKCIAQFAGLQINQVSDKVIRNYLITWARNKYKYFKMLNNKLRVDIDFNYEHQEQDIKNELDNLSAEFPVYCYWLENFADLRNNKIETLRFLPYNFERKMARYFPNYKIIGSTITHFFKKCLNAPDELITKIAALFENQKIEAKYTISIDPVDMMLASENPYGWVSCYRLEADGNDGSHADGCLAAVLDSSSLITYVWNNEGKYKMYNNFEFKSIRYKRMRRWISISPDFSAIHFNDIYPGKKQYGEELDKRLRCIVEEVICAYTGAENKWRKNNGGFECDRAREEYGYNEYNEDYIYHLTDAAPYRWVVFDEDIECPCGCGTILYGNYGYDYDDEEYQYNGNGFNCENFVRRYYCEEAGGYCEWDYDNCTECNETECWAWKRAHPVCGLDINEECDDPDNWDIDDEGVMTCSEEHCCNCPLYKKHHPDVEDEEE